MSTGARVIGDRATNGDRIERDLDPVSAIVPFQKENRATDHVGMIGALRARRIDIEKINGVLLIASPVPVFRKCRRSNQIRHARVFVVCPGPAFSGESGPS
ncbi:MAG: hypothetical protein DMF29_11550 [Verrucomicrobia bacterium]|nr:MAG: hypothetical protein DMF29_11550 [Verrucomicrobiota bacterium]